MGVDRLQYPRLAQYIEGLPQGLASHPKVQTKADFSLILRRHLAPLITSPALPEPVCQILLAPWEPGSWIPTTSYVALCAFARDAHWKTESDYHQGMLDVAAEMYSGPLYRALFVMFGPSLVAMGAAKRWHTLHQGTELVLKKQNKESVDLRVDYPSKLMSKTAVQSLGAAFCAIAKVSRASQPTFELQAFQDTSADLAIRWTF